MIISTRKYWKELLAKATLENDESQWEVGYSFENGLKTKSGKIIIERNLKKAIKWYRLSAEQKNESAELSLATLLSTEKTCENFEEAIYWSEKAIKEGSASAAHNLATIYRDLQKDKLSFKYYQKAVAMGDKDSLLQVGLCYLFGYGTKQNYILAQKTIQKIQQCQVAETSQRTRENALYWLGVIDLLNLTEQKQSLKKIRTMLENANQDDDHEQANELLNIIGKNKYLKT